jgi:hypothetical protein
VFSWEDLCHQFVANFQGTFERPGTESDLHAVVQRKGESLRQFIQRFSQVRNTIPKIPPHAVIVAFRHGVRDGKMLEKLGTRDVHSTAELFALADKCAKAAEARAWHQPRPDQSKAGDAASPSEKKKKKKRKPELVLAAEPQVRKAPRDGPRGGEKKAGALNKGTGMWCPIHHSDQHDLADCREVKILADNRRQARREGDRGASGGRNREGERGPRVGRGQDRPQRDRSNHGVSGDQDGGFGFQEPKAVACIHGGASAFASRRQFKLLARELGAAVPSVGVSRPLRWSGIPITFNQADHPKSSSGVGRLPLVVSPTICNIQVTRMLVDGGAGLNVLTPEVFKKMQVPPGHLLPMMPFYGVTSGLTVPLGQVSLMVTFGTRDNYRTEGIIFDVADIDLPYNGILGRPALAKFMAASHYAYLTIKIPGPQGPITVPADLRSSVLCAEKLHLAAAPGSGDGDYPECSGSAPRRARTFSGEATPVKEMPLGDDPSRTVKIGGHLDAA